nr:putative membrane protein [Kluyveromyces lactis]
MALIKASQARAVRENPHVSHQFNISSFLGDPFAIGTLSIALISWIIALAGSIAVAASTSPFPRFSWWTIVYEILLMITLFIVYCLDLVDYYRMFITCAVGIAFVYTTISTNSIVYYEGSKSGAAAAGFILLSMINLVWVIYFGGDNASPTNRWIDSFSLRGIRPSVLETSMAIARSQRLPVKPSYPYQYQEDLRSASLPDVHHDDEGEGHSGNMYAPELQSSTKYVSSTVLNGFENTDHSSSKPNLDVNAQNTATLNTQATGTFITDTTNANTDTTMGDTLGLYSDIGEELNSFPYTAEALYTYQADQTDAYEISFEQGEILRVGDIEGRWWKAKKSNGETGIIPSNYVKLLDGKSH